MNASTVFPFILLICFFAAEVPASGIDNALALTIAQADFKSCNPIVMEATEEADRIRKLEAETGVREVDRLRMLKQKYGGEEGWQEHEKSRRLEALGLAHLQGVFSVQQQLSEGAVFSILEAEKRAGLTYEQLHSLEKELFDEADRIRRRNHEQIRPTLFRLAATPEALTLAKRAALLWEGWQKRFYGPRANLPITKGDLESIGRSVESIRRGLMKLPCATPEQIQADIAALPIEYPSR